MTSTKIRDKLNELMALPTETEWVEFKQAKRNFDFNDLGQYFSALSNEANLKDQECGWLVFGITDELPRTVVGSQYRPNRGGLDSLKKEIADKTNNRLTFEDIHEIILTKGRVLMFSIPPALKGMPTSWRGHFYGREGESLGPLNLSEIERIRGQAIQEDWSEKICEGASLNDLAPDAILFARVQYKEKNPKLLADVDRWDDLTFLNKARVCISGKITNAAIVLLGKGESGHFLSPARAWITWVLKDELGVERDYEHYGPPLILAVEQVFAKLRNLTYRYLSLTSLFPTEISQYDPWVIRETLHNCIAHQNYSESGPINAEAH